MAIIVIISLWDMALPTVCMYYGKQKHLRCSDMGLWPRFMQS